MTRRVMNTVAAVAVAALAVAGCDKGKDKDKDEPRGAPAATSGSSAAGPAEPAAGKQKAPAEPAAKPYRDDTYGFAVDSARSPDKGEQEVPTPIGNVTAYTFMFSESSAPGAILVMVAPSYLPADEPDPSSILQGAEQGAINGVGGKVVESTDIEVDGVTGRSVTFTARPAGQAATGHMKLFLRDGALYQVLSVHADGATGFAAESQRFMDSFRFIPVKS